MRSASFIVGLALFGGAHAEWQPPVGPPEFQVNTHVPNDQRIPVVAVDALGNGVVIWQSRNQDDPSWGVHAQRIDAEGRLVGDEFRVNRFNIGRHEGQHVQMLPDGRFLVSWHGPDRASASDATIVQKRWFDAQGQALTSDQRVSDEGAGLQILPRLALSRDGRHVLAWEGQAIVDPTFNILRRAFGPDDNPLFPVESVNQFMTSAQRRADVAMIDSGLHVIVWQSAIQDGNDWGVFARCMQLDGEDGDEFQVNQSSEGAQARPRLALADSGAFAVVWQDNTGLSSFQYQRVMARLYGPDCQPLTGEIQVNSFDQGIQDLPAVSVDPEGRYIVVWQSFPPDFVDQGIYGRWLAPDGAFLGPSFRISQEVEAYQDYPEVAALPDGGLLATWETIGQDGSGFGIYARRMALPQFVPPIEPLPVPGPGRLALLLLILVLLLPASRRLC